MIGKYDSAIRVAVHGVPDRIIHAASRPRQLAMCGLDSTGTRIACVRCSRARRWRGDSTRRGGHLGYEDLPSVLRRISELGPGLGLELFYERELHEASAAGNDSTIRSSSTRCSRSAATERCCAALG